MKLGQRMSAVIVAEGVETEDQRATSAIAGVAQGQGYLISRPSPLAAFRALIRDGELGSPPQAHRNAEVA